MATNRNVPPAREFGRLLSQGIKMVAMRQSKTITQVKGDIAEELGFSSYTVDHWMQGYVPPDAKNVRRLAEICVQEGKADQEWATSFLTHARYPERDAVIAELFPSAPALPSAGSGLDPRPPVFVGREDDIKLVVEGLASGYPLIALEGLGGVGKTTLALEVAYRCREGTLEGIGEPFQVIAWISAKGQPERAEWWHEVLDTIARLSEWPYIAEIPVAQKVAAVQGILETRRVLVIIDNFETIADPDLVRWMQRVPPPSKVLITSRENQLRRLWDIPLRGLDEFAALALIRSMSRPAGLADLVSADDATLLPLVAVTAGNPKAIELALGHIQDGATLSEVVNGLHHAQQTYNDIFDYLCSGAWQRLDDDARHVLLAVPFFGDVIYKDALAAASGLSGYYLDTALAHLVRMSLVDPHEQTSEPQRFSIHPLVRAFAAARLSEASEWEVGARARWVAHYLTLTEPCANPRNFHLLRPEIANVLLVMRWLADQGRLRELAAMYAHVEPFLYAEGYWDTLIEYANQLAQWALEQRAPEALTPILLGPIGVFRRRGQPQEGRIWLDRAAQAAAEFEDSELMAETLYCQGALWDDTYIWAGLVSEADADKAIAALERAREIYARVNPAKVLQALNALGNCHLRIQRYDEAIAYYQQGLRELETLAGYSSLPRRSHPYDAKGWRAVLNGNLGLVAGRQGKWEEATATLLGVLPDLDQTDSAEVYAALALYAHHLGHEDDAVRYRSEVDSSKTRLGLTRPLCTEDAEWERLHDQ